MAPGLAAAPPPAHQQAAPVAAPMRLAPAAALLAARAESAAGRPERALQLLRQALPQSQALAPLLRLEAARIQLQRGQNPWPFLLPLWTAGTPTPVRKQGQELALQAVRQLPLPLARLWQRHKLPRPLQRRLQAELALREKDKKAALALLAESLTDAAASQAAWSLLGQKLLPKEQALVAQALLASGFWQESHELLSCLPYAPAEGFPLTYARARSAYRLGLWEEAIHWFALAEAAAGTEEEARNCWLFAARAWEQKGQEACAAELYEKILLTSPLAPEGWIGLGQLLVRQGQSQQALQLWQRAPASVQELLAPRLCAALALHNQLGACSQLLALAPQLSPELSLCQAYVLLVEGQEEKAQKALAKLLAQEGQLRELAAWLVREEGSASPPPARHPQALAQIAVGQGLSAARKALALALEGEGEFAPLLTAGPKTPPLSPPLAQLLAAGLPAEAALLPGLFPQSTGEELAWSAAFLAENGQPAQALALGEKLWQRLGKPPACLLPESLLRWIVPPALGQLLPPGPQRPLLFALARQESRFDSQARSPVGAQGLFQLMPATLRRLGHPLSALAQEEGSAAAALAHLQKDAARLGGDPLLLAAAFNAGESWVSLWLGSAGGPHPLWPLAVPYRETRAYLLAVAEGLWLGRHLK